MRPPVRLLQPLEAPSLQLSKSIYVCSSCRHSVLTACSLSHAQARRHASGGTSFTDRLRQRIWGTDQPPGLEDPYGGEGLISKAWKKRKAQYTGEEEQDDAKYEEHQKRSAAEASRVGQQEEPGDTKPLYPDFVPAESAEGLKVIGHRGRWTEKPRKESDQYSPFVSRSKARTGRHVRSAAQSVIVELCVLHQLNKPLLAACEATVHEGVVWKHIRRCRIDPAAENLSKAIIYPYPDAEKILHFVFSQLGSRAPKPQLREPPAKSRAVNSMIDPQDDGYLSFPLTNPNVRFAYLTRLAQVTGHYIPDSEMRSMTTIRHAVEYLEKAIKPPQKLADELSNLPDRHGIPNLIVNFSRYTKAHQDRDLGRRKVIEEALRERGLLYEQDDSPKFRL